MMIFTEREVASLKSRLDAALTRGSWETGFLRDMRARLERDGVRTRLTGKQSSKLYEVLGRHAGAWQGVSFDRRSRRRKPRRALPWAWRALGWRLRRQLTFIALVMTAMFVAGMGKSLMDGMAPVAGSAVVPAGWAGERITGGIRVIDGDTVAVGGEHFRLIGLNTPETFEPRCAAEKKLGERAKERLKDLLATGSAELTKVPCSCPPGTEGTSRCNFGRSCGVLAVDGRDVASTLVGEGLAAAFHCGAASCPPLPRPWCT